MIHYNYPKEYMIHGISSEMLRGNENTIYSPVWFAESDDSYLWTYEKAWTRDNLRELRKEDVDFVYFLKESERVSLNEGETVYLAGYEFMDKILSFVKSGDIKFSVSAWEQISNGYYISVMTPAAFSAFIEHLCLELWKIVEKFLIDGNDESKVTAMEAFDAYTAIAFYSAEDKKELSIRKAMVYMHIKDTDMLHIESYLSVNLDQFFDTTELFQTVVCQRLNALEQ
jgi:hypothetical protein